MKNQKKQTLLASIMMSAIFFTVSLPIASCSQSKAENVSLDGKKFTVVSMVAGKPETSTISEISFTNGMFDDEICHLYGYTPGKYTATKDGDNYNFEATITSPSEGTETFKGMIMGDKIHGETIWHKEGQADINYAFSNMGHVITSLDGKVFTTEMKMGDSTMTEEISFMNGKFESPGCYQWGFSASPYTAWQMNGKTMWQCIYKSEKEGWMLFNGYLNGNELTASEYWHKDGQDDMIENFTGIMKQ